MKNLRILLVEDHPDTQELMQLLLRSFHYVVKTATSVQSALDLASSEDFDLVISDLGLPDGSGLSLMAQLREMHGLKGIALTGYGSDDDLRRSEQAGFIAHLTKPIDFGRLQQMIGELAGSK